jgi:cell division protein FtsN
MKRKAVKKDVIEKISLRTPRFWAMLFVVMVILILVAGFFTGKLASVSTASSSLYAKAHDWMSNRNARINQQLVKVKKKPVSKPDQQQEIHFEFYTVLPNMRMPVRAVEKPVVTLPSKIMTVNKAPEVPSIFDAGKLQSALKNEWKMAQEPAQVDKYMLQMAVFKSANSAEKYLQTFLSSGLTARVVSIETSKGKNYRVQVGPFQTKNQAMLVQRQLRKKNVNSIIRKI